MLGCMRRTCMQMKCTWWHDMQCMTRKQWQMQQQRITGGHLAHRSRGVTTLHHYERISSRDLEWHRRDNGRERGEVKLSCFFDKRVKPRALRGWTNWKKECNENEGSWKHSVRTKNKDEQILAALRLKRYARLDKAKRICAKGVQHSG